MQIVGQPARDVGRHFVQRWNYILRQRVPSRPTPVLIPPPEYEQGELEQLGMTGTCQVQICRSCSPWSIGTPNKVEHSIMNAYTSLIEASEHFVYIENQFYVSSCVVEGTTIHNKIGDALVERAIRAHENGEDWKACLVIPLMPGFQNSVDSQDGTSVRLIMQCQYRSICRGEASIWGRLKAVGINPENYIRFYSLRQWGKIGPKKCLTTEQLYIHAKCMVVDDRHVIIGSANINERSMLGSRDSEVASVVTDHKMIPSKMAGQPYMVGEFPHTLRKRLMREHLGIDVDAVYRREQLAKEREMQDKEMERIYREDFAATPATGLNEYFTPPQTPPPNVLTQQNLEANEAGFAGNKKDLRGWVKRARSGTAASVDSADLREKFKASEKQGTHNKQGEMLLQHNLDVEGYGVDNERELEDAGDIGLRDTYVDAQGNEVLQMKDAPGIQRIKQLENAAPARRRSEDDRLARKVPRPPWPVGRMDTYHLGLPSRSTLPELPVQDDSDIGGPALAQSLTRVSTKKTVNPLLYTLDRPEVTEDCMTDPLAPGFFEDTWSRIADNNTRIYRQVFRCMPDSEVLDWDEYKRFNDYNDRFMQSQGLGNSKPRAPKEAPGRSGPPGSAGANSVVTSAISDETKEKSKGLLGPIASKIRPGSKSDGETTHTQEASEKQQGDSPDTVPSSEPTAVPSPNEQPLDYEKEAAKDGEAATESEARQNSRLDAATSPSQDDTASAMMRQRTIQIAPDANEAPETTATSAGNNGLQHSTSQKRRRRATTKSSARPNLGMEEVMSREDAEELLEMVQGHLVQWPYDW